MNTNVVNNGDFSRDADADGLADAWNASSRRKDLASFDLEPRETGGNAQKITVASPEAARIGCYFGIASDPVDLPDTRTVKLTAEIKADNVVSCHVLLFFKDAENRPLAIPLVPSPVGDVDPDDAWDFDAAYPAIPQTWRNGSWDFQTYSAVIPVPAEAARAEIDVWFRHSGTLRVSNVTVTAC